eukprot:6180896-Pleurochrysis_carterae.AAC.2
MEISEGHAAGCHSAIWPHRTGGAAHQQSGGAARQPLHTLGAHVPPSVAMAAVDEKGLGAQRFAQPVGVGRGAAHALPSKRLEARLERRLRALQVAARI